jgi:hypothetical protein
LLAALGGCIPSHRIVYEGDRYFEHCYGADFDRRVTPEQREACWEAWLAHYTRYQPAHRIDYAMRRTEALQAGEPPLGLPGLPGQPDAVPVDSAEAALLKTAQLGVQPNLPDAPERGDGGDIPNGCVSACDRYEARCQSECEVISVACRHGCTRERAICLGGCY